jgi:hypothetical protein
MNQRDRRGTALFDKTSDEYFASRSAATCFDISAKTGP